MKEVFCSACGQSMTTSKGETNIGIQIDIRDTETNKELYPTINGKVFNVCWFCLVKKLGCKTI